MSILTLFGLAVHKLSNAQISQLIEDKKTLSAQVDHLKTLRAAEFKVLRAATDQIVKLMEFSEIDTRVLNKCCDEAEAETVVLRNELTMTVMALNNANMRITEFEKDMAAIIESRRIAHQSNATLTAHAKTLQDENEAMKRQHAINAHAFMKDPLAQHDVALMTEQTMLIGECARAAHFPDEWNLHVFPTLVFAIRELWAAYTNDKVFLATKLNARLVEFHRKSGNTVATFVMDNDFGYGAAIDDRFVITRVKA